MADDFKDILSHLSTDIDQETLLLYLQNKLSPERKHEVEKKLLENEFADDAAQGLQQVHDKERINHIVELLNRDLKKKLERKKRRGGKMTIKDQPWLYVSVIIVLMLIVIAYVVIRMFLKSK